MADLLIPDVSEFQTVNFDVFSGPIIVRAHNSNRADLHWRQHAAGASKQPWWAAYQYLTKNADPADAARAFLATLGDYRPNCTILDLEEGDGDQSARQHAWLSVMAGDPATDWTYSGMYFARSHNVAVDWIAAYGQREPTDAHRLWQSTDAQPFAGIGTCDASIFHGTIADLPGAHAHPAPQPQLEDDMALRATVDFDGHRYVFKTDERTGEVRYTLDNNEQFGNAIPGGLLGSPPWVDIDRQGQLRVSGKGHDDDLTWYTTLASGGGVAWATWLST